MVDVKNRIWGPILATASPSPKKQQQPYSTWMADSTITRGVEATRWYTEATFYRGVEAAHNASGDARYLSFLGAQIDGILQRNGSFRAYDLTDHQLDNMRIGAAILYLYTTATEPSGRARYRAAADFLYDQLVHRQKRTASGGFWHKDRYPNQMWLDGLFMAGPFSAAYVALLGSQSVTDVTAAWDDIALQFDLTEMHCRDGSSGMLRHGYDESLRASWADKADGSGASPHVWIRAQGWYLMALADVLDWFPLRHAARPRLLGYLQTLARAVVKAQDAASGGWWLVMDGDNPGRKGNYIESSGTAMYVYGLLKAVRKGYHADVAEGTAFVAAARRAYALMTDRFVARNGTNGGINWEGTVRVGSLDTTGDFKYYTSIPVVENSLIGIGPFILASVEMEQLPSS
ncbi:putative cell wall glycosyl hydrolase YteR [Lasiosphaeria ovina]|uniref:Cell wall glycosyl hydrolase YteR n=1 Tax=Lasiosphaeria ovina TaxID=92902 RepID=A0AAE0KG36_9PEZI|nr:putative cell wall glycosyl hydrolase YteR [Lasiosphaeria ovina]